MRVTSINTQQVSLPEQINPADMIRKIYPDIKHSFFMESPNVYDKSYISGTTREQSAFTDGYTSKKIAISHEMRRIYSNCPVYFSHISRDEANTSEGSWLTVISGKRPMGQFSVDSLYSPELHALFELPNIGCKIFPKEKNDFLYIIVVYRKDCEQGEQHAERFIELYNKKRELMDALRDSPHELKVIWSELAIAREMGRVFNYLPEEIDSYIQNLNSSASQLAVTSHNHDNPHQTRIIIGCGALNKRKLMDEGTHIGEHLQCDTMDIDPDMGSSILADITRPLQSKMYDKYSTVMCEGLPPEVYNSDVFYNNLKLITQSKASFVFSGLTENTRGVLVNKLNSHRFNFSESKSISELPQSLLIDEDLLWNIKLEYSEEFRKHPPIIANK